MSIPNEPAQRFTGGLLRGWRGFLKQIDYLMSTNGKTYLQLNCICKFNFGLKYFTFILESNTCFSKHWPWHCGTSEFVACCTCWTSSRARGVAWVKTSMWMLWTGSSRIKHPMSNHLKAAKRLKNSFIHSYFSIYQSLNWLNTWKFKWTAGQSLIKYWQLFWSQCKNPYFSLEIHSSEVLELFILTNTTPL